MRTRLLTAAACLVAFLVVAAGVGSRSGVSGFDASIAGFFAADAGSFLRSTADLVTRLGVLTYLLPVALIVGGLVMWRLRMPVLALAPVVSVQVSSVLVREAKRHYMVPRPPSAPLELAMTNPAFPSGHTANTTALLTAVVLVTWLLARTTRSKVALVATGVGVSASMAWSRLALGVHWFSDVVGGLALGACVGFVVVSAAMAAEGRLDRSPDGRGQKTSDLDA